MRRAVQFLVFFLAFFGLSFTAHVYIFSHLSYLLRIEPTPLFWAFVVFSSIWFFLGMVLGSWFAGPAMRAFHVLSMVWLGIMLYTMFTLFFYDGARLTAGAPREVAAPVIVGIVALLTAASLVIPRFVRVRELDIPAPRLDREVRLVQLSDVHIGDIRGKRYLAKLVDMANALQPDLVLITGDLADGPHRYDSTSFAPLDGLKAPVLFTIGNHEYYAGLEVVLPLIAKTKVRTLRNEVVDIGDIRVVGIDDGHDGRLAAKVLAEAPAPAGEDPFIVLMYHRPVGIRAAHEAGVDLMLSGHTHAGQFLPFPLLARAIWKRWYTGLHEYQGTYLYASSGAGTWGPPFRLGTRSEIALIRLNGGKEGAMAPAPAPAVH